MKKILIVRQQNNQLGDLLCSLPLYHALKKGYPESEISLIAGKTNYKIPYKKFCPYIDNIVQMDRETFKKNIDFIKEVRRFKCEIGIIPSTMQFSRSSHVINYLSGAKVRVGVKQIDDLINKSSFLLNVKGSFNWGKEKVHQTDRILDVVKQTGCELSEDEKRILLKYTDEELRGARDFKNSNFPKDTKIIGMHAGAGKEANRWDVKNFVELSIRLRKELNCVFLITSGYIDKEITERLIQGLRDNDIPFVVENLEVRLLGALLSMIDVYVSNDTGVMHLAGFSGGRVVSLFGPTKGYEWAPQQKGCRYIQSVSSDINDIGTGEVYEAVINILNSK